MPFYFGFRTAYICSKFWNIKEWKNVPTEEFEKRAKFIYLVLGWNQYDFKDITDLNDFNKTFNLSTNNWIQMYEFHLNNLKEIEKVNPLLPRTSLDEPFSEYYKRLNKFEDEHYPLNFNQHPYTKT